MNLHRQRMTRKPVNDFISQAGIIQEVDSFQTGVKRQIIKTQLAHTVLDQRLDVLRTVFKYPQETYQSLRDLIKNEQLAPPLDRELID
ncbi:hypothetical protein C0J52_11746 [Blattella germanica]|nr:hypothetical protein C0J52_11746 [Blattella germanica]